MKYHLYIYWSKADNAFIAPVPELPGCDEIIRADDLEFAATELKKESLVRLSFLHVFRLNELKRSTGYISDRVYQKLLLNLSKHISRVVPVGWALPTS